MNYSKDEIQKDLTDSMELYDNVNIVEDHDIEIDYISNFISNKLENLDDEMAYSPYILENLSSISNSSDRNSIDSYLNLKNSSFNSFPHFNKDENEGRINEDSFKISNSSISIETSKHIKKYNCIHENCSKIFKTKENLNLHIKNIHLKIKPYSCAYCPAVFSHRNGINIFNF